MNAGEQTSRHLLLAVITTVFSTLMSLVTLVMSWEPWMIPLMSVGCVSVWLLHIARIDLIQGLDAGIGQKHFVVILQDHLGPYKIHGVVVYHQNTFLHIICLPVSLLGSPKPHGVHSNRT